jgi:hypothetical protein
MPYVYLRLFSALLVQRWPAPRHCVRGIGQGGSYRPASACLPLDRGLAWPSVTLWPACWPEK